MIQGNDELNTVILGSVMWSFGVLPQAYGASYKLRL